MLVHTQIPLSRNNWLTALEFTQVSFNLKNSITRQEITNLRDFLRRKPLTQMSTERLDRCLEPICKLLSITPERKILADGVLRQSFISPLYQFLTQKNVVAIEKHISTIERVVINEKHFSSVFQSLDHELLELPRVKCVNQALGNFILWAQSVL